MKGRATGDTVAVFACTQLGKQGHGVTDVMQLSKITKIRVKSVDKATSSVGTWRQLHLTGLSKRMTECVLSFLMK